MVDRIEDFARRMIGNEETQTQQSMRLIVMMVIREWEREEHGVEYGGVQTRDHWNIK